jgi:DNA-binding LacI/PurR family transcriptional regulator
MGLAIESRVADRLMVRSVPTVIVDAPSGPFSSVVADDVEGGRIAARHLVELGHRRVVFLTEQHRLASEPLQADQRLAGFTAIWRESGRAASDLIVVAAANRIEDAARATDAPLQRGRRPTAIVAHHDGLAAGALLAARSRGLSTPAELSVMGFDDGDLAAGLQMTTIRQPFEESGRIAARLLMERLKTRDLARHRIVLDLELIDRHTTGRPDQEQGDVGD